MNQSDDIDDTKVSRNRSERVNELPPFPIQNIDELNAFNDILSTRTGACSQYVNSLFSLLSRFLPDIIFILLCLLY